MRYCSLLLATCLVLGCSGTPAPDTTVAKGPSQPPTATAPANPPRGAPPGQPGGGPPTAPRGGAPNPAQKAPGGAPRQSINVRAELEKLPDMPVGLEIIHTPEQVSDVTPQVDKEWKFHWAFKTEVRAKEKPLTIEFFGTLIQEGDKWVIPQKPGQNEATAWGVQQFIEWYKCPAGRVEPGKPVVDAENWSGSNLTTGFKQKWFYVAKDDEGKRWKGEAIVELLPKK